MPADERMKVIFRRVYVLNDADTFGSGEFYFTASVGGEAVGGRSRTYNAVEHRTIDLSQPRWSKIINVRNRTEVPVIFTGMDEDVLVDDNLSRVSCTLRLPFTQQRYTWRHRTRYFMLDWEVQLSIGGSFGRHPARSVFACRQNAGAVTCTTVSGRHFQSRGEIHPVQPVPLPPPATATPLRPPGVVGAHWPPAHVVGPTITATSPMNILTNPAVIPRLQPPGTAGTGLPAVGPPSPQEQDYATSATERNCARIRFTYYRPDTLNFDPDTRRLEWRAVPVADGGAATFLGPARGREVLVYGTHDGEVRLEVRYQGALFATYRALVRQVQPITCRFNILNGPTAGTQPRATPDDVKNHFEIANRFIRQLGLQLRLDTNAARSNGATATNHPGIFRIRLTHATRGRTWRVPVGGWPRACRMNMRASILSFAYIHSDRAGNLGAAISYPANGAGNQITDPPAAAPVANATPSTSWIRPSGVAPDVAAVQQRLTLIAARLHANASRQAHRAMYVTDANGGANHRSANAQLTFGGTIAHELGHMLNLGHRVEGVPETAPGAGDARSMTAADAPASLNANGQFWDGLLHPYDENVMHWRNGSNLAQDFDLIQARAVHRSPMVPTV